MYRSVKMGLLKVLCNAGIQEFTETPNSHMLRNPSIQIHYAFIQDTRLKKIWHAGQSNTNMDILRCFEYALPESETTQALPEEDVSFDVCEP
ncbi:hypothetical protein AVEN_12819-1 [Araneus ventricosus]|uniref:Uncharacterized protein n=1 Tax=Araneus ventricosus TaxID=182803 RepID=A0A4Y2ABH8_ARAVE|nr:hypothetical protein AVEN_12819-1 [Araneus ventricosus]